MLSSINPEEITLSHSTSRCNWPSNDLKHRLLEQNGANLVFFFFFGGGLMFTLLKGMKVDYWPFTGATYLKRADE